MPSVAAQLAGQLLEQHGILVTSWHLNGRLLSVSHKAKKWKKSVMHVQSCCFAYSTYCFFDVLIVIAVVVS